MEYVKQSMNQVWASAGDVVMPNNTKIQEGWLVEVPPRQYWNWMQNRTDTNLAYIFQRGIPEWDATTEYIANKSFVVYNGVTYKAILTGTNQNPLTATTYWQRAFSTWSAAGEAVGALTPSANTYAYFTGSDSAALGTITPFARTVLDDTDAIAVRGTIGAQQKDATLDAIAGLTTAANKLPYFTGVDVASVTDLSAFGRSLIDDNDAASARTTLGAAPLASPTFTGAPTAPTAPTGTNTTQLATTAFVQSQKTTSATDTTSGRVWRTDDLVKTTSATDTTAGRVTKVGDFGIGGMLDLRSTIYSTGIPSDMFGVGTLFGLADGNTLGISGLVTNSYGVLTVNSQWNDSSGGWGTSRSFLYGQRMFLQGAASASAWQPWVEVATSANSLGQGQTWQDVTGSRALGTTYTNTTGRPIYVEVATTFTAPGSLANSTGGVVMYGATAATGHIGTIGTIVPNGGAYSIFLNGGPITGTVWLELR